jgi:hypothetical protein
VSEGSQWIGAMVVDRIEAAVTGGACRPFIAGKRMLA